MWAESELRRRARSGQWPALARRPHPCDRGYVVFDFLGVVDQGEAFSARSVGLLRRLKLIFASIAAYEVLGFVGISVATLVAMGQMKTYMLLSLFAAEVVGLFFFALVALLERLFATALKLRQENELTV